MKRVIIWGCGKYGQYLYNIIMKLYSNRYTIVGMGDSDWQVINEKLDMGEVFFDVSPISVNTHIYGYADVKRMFDEGDIEGIFIGILNENARKQVEDIFSVMGLEIFDLQHESRVFAEEIAEEYEDYGGLCKRYLVKEINLSVVKDWSESYQYTYLLTKDGKVLYESDRYLSLSKTSPSKDVFLMNDDSKTESITLDKATPFLQIGSDFNYGHFVFYCVGKLSLLERNGYDGLYIFYDNSFIREWVKIISEIYSIKPNRIVWIDRMKEGQKITINKLYCFENISDSGYKNACLLNFFVNDCKNFYRSNFASEMNKRTKRIYLKRSGTRKMHGCEEVLERFGFFSVNIETLPVFSQIELLAQADIVVAEHGAAVTNCIFMKENSYLVETFGAGFVDSFFVEAIKLRNINFRMLVSQKEYADYKFGEDYVINPTLMEMTLSEIVDNIDWRSAE